MVAVDVATDLKPLLWLLLFIIVVRACPQRQVSFKQNQKRFKIKSEPAK